MTGDLRHRERRHHCCLCRQLRRFVEEKRDSDRSLYSIGPNAVELSYARRSYSLETGEQGAVEYSQDGNNWSTLETLTGSSDWLLVKHALEVTGADLHLRFRVSGNAGNDEFQIDEVEVRGGTTDPNSPPSAGADNYSKSLEIINHPR